MTIYLVNGPCRYRDHDIGDTFEATLEPDVEARALSIGTISIHDPTPSGLRPGSWTLPRGWLTNENTEPPHGGFSLKGA